MVRTAARVLLLVGVLRAEVAVAPPAGADDLAAGAAPAELGPVAYRVVRLEALRLRVPDRLDGDVAPVDLGAAGRWHPVDARAPAVDADGALLDDVLLDEVLLDDLRRADGPTSGRARAPPADDGARAPRTTVGWHLVATWEAAALVRSSADGGATLGVARARRVVAIPLPPPDLSRTPRGTASPWPADVRRPPPPHPEPATPPTSRRVPRGRAPAASAAAATPLARAIEKARAGDPVGAAAALADPTTLAATTAHPGVGTVDAVLASAWRGEIALAVGDARAAADRLGAAADLASALPPAVARTDVVAFLRERAAVAAWRAGAPGRAAQRAVAGLARPHGRRDARPPPPAEAWDDRGDATLRGPPTDGGGVDARPDHARPDDGDDGLAAARRATAAWWRARRR